MLLEQVATWIWIDTHCDRVIVYHVIGQPADVDLAAIVQLQATPLRVVSQHAIQSLYS
jgi:hypothetical protein